MERRDSAAPRPLRTLSYDLVTCLRELTAEVARISVLTAPNDEDAYRLVGWTQRIDRLLDSFALELSLLERPLRGEGRSRWEEKP